MSLAYEPKNVWKNLGETEKKEMMEFSEGYKDFLAAGVTERLCVELTVKMAEEKSIVIKHEKDLSLEQISHL